MTGLHLRLIFRAGSSFRTLHRASRTGTVDAIRRDAGRGVHMLVAVAAPVHSHRHSIMRLAAVLILPLFTISLYSGAASPKSTRSMRTPGLLPRPARSSRNRSQSAIL